MEIGKIGNIFSINRKILSHPDDHSLSHRFMHRSVLEKKLRNRFALAVICCLIYHWLEVSR